MTYFKNLIKENDKNINLFHQKKDIAALENVLENLNREHTILKKNLNSVIYLLDLVDKHKVEIKHDQNKDTFDKLDEHQDYSKLAQSKKDIFERLYSKSTKLLNVDEVDFLKQEIPKLTYEKEKFTRQMKYLNDITVKTIVLLKDLRDELCKEITDGNTIEAVSKKISTNLGKKIVGTYASGRKTIVNFLEKAYKINRIKSKELIDLLDKSKTINFKIDISKNDVFYYYKDYGFADQFVPVIGSWTINKVQKQSKLKH